MKNNRRKENYRIDIGSLFAHRHHYEADSKTLPLLKCFIVGYKLYTRGKYKLHLL